MIKSTIFEPLRKKDIRDEMKQKRKKHQKEKKIRKEHHACSNTITLALALPNPNLKR